MLFSNKITFLGLRPFLDGKYQLARFNTYVYPNPIRLL